MTDTPSPDFSGVHASRSLVFCVVFCRSLYVFFLLVIVLFLYFFNLRLLISALVLLMHSENNVTDKISEFIWTICGRVASGVWIWLLQLWWFHRLRFDYRSYDGILGNGLITSAVMPSWATGWLIALWWSHGSGLIAWTNMASCVASWLLALEWLHGGAFIIL
jgi:hypothetical protein